MKKLSIIGSTVVAYLFYTLPALAVEQIDPCPQGDQTGAQFNQLCNVEFGTSIGRIITAVLVIAVLLALAFLIWGAIRWILSGGDKAKVEAARGTIIAAIVGLVIAFLAFFLLQIVLSFFGVGQINELQIPTIGV